MKIAPFLLLLVLFQVIISPVFAQLADDFSDGDFLTNPIWTGDTGRFVVNSGGELQSDGVGTDEIYLSTTNSELGLTEWRFTARFGEKPSNSNFARIYLVSNNDTLTGDLEGYYLRLGESGSDDAIDFIRRDGAADTTLIEGPVGTIVDGFDLTIKVLRDIQGNWEVLADFDGDEVFDLQGMTRDTTYQSTSYFGVVVNHTSTRADEFFFDDFYIGPPIVDLEAPTIDTVEVISMTELEVTMSESLDSVAARVVGNYTLDNGLGNPQMATWAAQAPNKVMLTFPAPFVSPTNYTLEVQGLSDRNGNQMPQPDSISFLYAVPDVAAYRDVIINEIYPDPTPPIGLPDAEFLELYNSSSKTLDLDQWTIDNGSTKGTLPAFQLLPGDYVILTSESNASLFAGIGPTISPSSWPALVNGGDDLGLRSQQGELIDSVQYRSSWYRDENKEEGGYSLELINPQANGCPDRSNWRGSEAAAGGTPARRNSVFSLASDTTAPEILSIEVTAPDRITLCFNESMNASLISDPAHYVLAPSIGNPVSVVNQGVDNQCVELDFGSPLPAGDVLTLTVSNVADCSGNLTSSPLQGAVAIGSEAEPFDVVITELLPDYEPAVSLPEAEFVELYNRTDEVLSLAGWTITDGSATGEILSGVIFPNEYLILCDDGDSAAFAAFGKVLLPTSLPSLNNASDQLILNNSLGEVMEYVQYSDDWYRDELKAEGGWTLERIDPDFVDCNTSINWRASEDANGGTPGAENSQLGTVEDNVEPTVQGISIIDAMSVVVYFDEPMDRALLGDEENYEIDQGIGEPIVAMPVAPDNLAVELLFPQALDSSKLYTLTYADIADCAGNEISGEIRFGLPRRAEPGDIFINEILFNPYTGGSDFVEIYNVSDKVLDLSELYIGEIFPGTDSIFNADQVAPQSALFLPGQWLCLTSDVAFQQAAYMPPGYANFWEMNRFPTYDDDEGECVIFTGLNQIIDRFYYEDDFHFPTLSDKNGVSLERISRQRPASAPGNWHSAASTANHATPGYENSQAEDLNPADQAVSLERQTFSPDDDGFEDVLLINYNFDFAGANVRVTIFDAQGRPIRLLHQNLLLGTKEGTFFWDGRDDKNTKADVGMYVVLVEALRQETGEKQVYKHVCVLATRF